MSISIDANGSVLLGYCLILPFWRPLRKSHAGSLCFGIDDRRALGVHQHSLGLDLHISASQRLAGQLNELFGVLRGIEER